MTKWELEDIKLVAELNYNWDKFTNKTILISGGTGFIGSFVIKVLKYRNREYNQGIRIVSLTRSGGKTEEDVVYLKSDIRNPIEVDEKIDYVLHLASNTHPKQYAQDPVGTITTNILGCNNLLKFATEQNVDKFLLTSSVEIYGEGEENPLTEVYSGYIDCNNARNGYNESKRTCEALCQSYKQQYGVDFVIARLARVFGPDVKNDSKAMSQFMRSAVLGEKIILKSKGTQRYSYCYVADAASAIIKLMLDGESGNAYNVSDNDEKMTLGAYARYIAQLADVEIEFQMEDNDSVSKATYALLDTNKIKSIGWEPSYSVQEGLNRTFLIYKERKKIEKSEQNTN